MITGQAVSVLLLHHHRRVAGRRAVNYDYAGALLATGVLAAISLWPRLGHKEGPTSALYFSHIARQHETQASYHETMKLLTVDTDILIKEIAGQVYANAQVAHKKFMWSGWALRALMLALGALGVVTLIIAKRSL